MGSKVAGCVKDRAGVWVKLMRRVSESSETAAWHRADGQLPEIGGSWATSKSRSKSRESKGNKEYALANLEATARNERK